MSFTNVKRKMSRLTSRVLISVNKVNAKYLTNKTMTRFDVVRVSNICQIANEQQQREGKHEHIERQFRRMNSPSYVCTVHVCFVYCWSNRTYVVRVAHVLTCRIDIGQCLCIPGTGTQHKHSGSLQSSIMFSYFSYLPAATNLRYLMEYQQSKSPFCLL